MTMITEMPPESAFAAQRPTLETLLTDLVVQGGSDLHLTVGIPPRIRIHGDLRDMEGSGAFDAELISKLVQDLLGDEKWARFLDTRDLDTSYAMVKEDGAALDSRFRVNVFRERGNPAAVFRVIPTKIKTIEDLDLKPIISSFASLPRGLVLVTGVTGSGKSTTLAALIDLINRNDAVRILTFEDPIEFEHHSKMATISQREIFVDTADWGTAMKAVLREDPDVILIGEMRDPETIQTAITAADTGHLVFATMHTSSAKDSISRIVDSFPSERQNQVRTMLASNLKAIICQNLIPAKNGGRVVATEIMVTTDGIKNSIREGDLPAIDQAMTDQSKGSILLDSHLAELVTSGKITRLRAIKKASNPESLKKQLVGVGGLVG